MSLSRRTLLLAGSLGPALACREGAQLGSAEPRFVGQSPERGHLLRSAALLDGALDGTLRTKVAIVGAGVAGLSAAWRLRKAGLEDIQIFELEADAGGTARTGLMPRSAHPMGAHYLPSPPRECTQLHELLGDLGLLVGRRYDGSLEFETTAICPAPLERHFHAGEWAPGLYPSAGQTQAEADQLERFWALLDRWDRRRDAHGRLLFRLPVRRSSPTLAHLDRITMAQWLADQGLDSWRLRWFVDYACRDDYGCGADQTSAFAGLHHYLGRGLAQNREGQILTFAGGNGALVSALRAFLGLGDRLKLDHLSYAVDPDAGELRVHDIAAGRSFKVEADLILWAAPRYLLPHVLPRGRDPLGPALRQGELSYAPWLVANLELRDSLGGLGAPLSWDNVPVIEDPRARNLGYVVATHNEGRDRVDTPGSVITYYEPLIPADASTQALRGARARLLAGSAGEWGEHVLRALEHMHPAIRRQVLQFHLHRWGHAMIRPTPGLIFGDALARAREPIAKLRACATDTGGLPLFEEAFYAATDAADWALAELGGHPITD